VAPATLFAPGALTHLCRPGLAASRAVRVAIEARYDAADDDSATGGPDLGRQIWPTVAVVDHAGARFVPQDLLEGHVEQVVASRRGNPGGAR
jgi:proteasome beta subunit